MQYKVVDTTGWSPAQMDRYWPQIFRLMEKLKARLPNDASYSVMLATWGQGNRKIWLTLDSDDRLVSFAMTDVMTNLATGQTVATLRDLAGEGVMETAVELNAAMEAWCDKERIPIRQIEGRNGWQKPAKQFGYDLHSVLLRKTVSFDGI